MEAKVLNEIEAVRDVCKKVHKGLTESFEANRFKIEQLGEPQILTWTNEIKYILDSGTLFITGNLGYAVMRFHTEYTFEDIAKFSFEDFYKRVKAFSGDRVFFDSEQAFDFIVAIVEEELSEEEKEELLEQVTSCDNHEEWLEWLQDHKLWFNERGIYEGEYTWDKLEKAGDSMPYQIEGFLIGLKMAMAEEGIS